MTRRFTLTLASLVVTLALIASAAPVAAKTTTISDDASCTAAGGTVEGPGQCSFVHYSVATGDTLTTAGTIDITFYGSHFAEDFSVGRGATVNLNASLPLRLYGGGANAGTININGGGLFLADYLKNTGTIVVGTGLVLAAPLYNDGTITVPCHGRIVIRGEHAAVLGNPPKYACPASTSAAGAGGTGDGSSVLGYDAMPLPGNLGTPDRLPESTDGTTTR